MKRLLMIAVAALLSASAQTRAEPVHFPTPQEAFDALSDAVEQRDQDALAKVFGAENIDLLVSEDRFENARNHQAFLALIRDGYRFRATGDGVDLILGADGWAFPIPIIKTAEGWRFDPDAGREELSNRLIGLNELTVIDLLRAYVDLQSQFRRVDHDGDGVMEFAKFVLSDAESRDGLFWPGGPGLIGQALARAELSGWSDGTNDFEPEPFSGYYFRILHAQGADAPGGAYTYVVGDNLVGGHAMIAVPAVYGETGVHSYLIAEAGTVYEADLGPDTLEIAVKTERFDPSNQWTLLP